MTWSWQGKALVAFFYLIIIAFTLGHDGFTKAIGPDFVVVIIMTAWSHEQYEREKK